MARYAELQVTSHFSFLRGASSCEDLFSQAALCSIGALAVCDRSSLAGIVRAHEAAKVTGVRAVVGCRLDLTDGTVLLVYPTDHAAYGRLCRLLSLGKARAGKGGCELAWSDVCDWREGLLATLVQTPPTPTARRACGGSSSSSEIGPTAPSPCSGVPATSCVCRRSPKWPRPRRWAPS